MPVAFVGASATQVDFDNSIDLNMPSLAGAAVDGSELLIAILRHSGGFGSAPAGWTVKVSGTNGFSICYKRIAGGESATYTFTAAALQIFSEARCVRLSGVPLSGDPFDSVPVQNFVNGPSSTNLALTTLTNNCYLLFADGHNNASASTSVAPSGMSAQGGNPNTLHLFDATQAATGTTGNKNHTTSASVDHYALLMAIKEGSVSVTATVPAPTDAAAAGDAGVLVTGTSDVMSATRIARIRAASALGYIEPALSGISTSTLLREYWGRRAGIAGDLSQYSVGAIMAQYFPGSHWIRDVN